MVDPFGLYDNHTLKHAMWRFIPGIREISEASNEGCLSTSDSLVDAYKLMMSLGKFQYVPHVPSAGIDQHDRNYDYFPASLIRRRMEAGHHLRDWKVHECYSILLERSKEREVRGDEACYAEPLSL